MVGTFSISSVLYILSCLIVGVLYAYVFYSGKNGLSRRTNISLAAIRALVVTLIAFLLFAPLLKFTQYTLQKPVIIIGQDNSISIKQVEPRDFSQQSYQKKLVELKKKLTEKFDVQAYHFGEKIGDDFDFSNNDKLTDGNAFLSKIKEEYANRNVGAVILATDGIFNKGANPLYELQAIRAPVYSIALGDTIPKKDAVVANVNYNNIVYLGDFFTVEVQIKVFDGDGETLSLNLSEEGKIIQKQTISVKGKNFVKTVSVKIKADRIGLQKFIVGIPSLQNEVTTKNNSQTFYVEVIDGAQKVLLAAAAPHPDLAVLKEAIASNKHFDVTLALGDKLNAIDPKAFDVIVLYQLPDVVGISSAFLDKVALVQKPIWFIVGGQTEVQSFNKFQKTIRLNALNGSLQEVYPVLGQDFNTFSLEQSDVKAIENLDPLLVPFGKMNVAANTNSVLSQRIGKIKTNLPLWFFVNQGTQKLGFLMGEGLWRWKLNEAQSGDSTGFVKELISKTIQYLSVKDDKRRFKVTPSKPSYEENEKVVLNATLYNESYQPTNDPDVNLVLKNQNGKGFNYIFSKTELGYQLNIGNLPAGSYTFLASTALGKEKLNARGGFYITAVLAEYRQTTANHQLLNTMAKQSGGKLVMPKDLLSLANDLLKNENIKAISYEDRKYVELINLKWLFVLILAFLSLEWFLRKRNGEV